MLQQIAASHAACRGVPALETPLHPHAAQDDQDNAASAADEWGDSGTSAVCCLGGQGLGVLPCCRQTTPIDSQPSWQPVANWLELEALLQDVLWGDACAPFLEVLTYGWCDGGCWLAAAALAHWITADAPAPAVTDTAPAPDISLGMVPGADGSPDHIVACVDGYCLDAYRARLAGAFLQHWRHSEHRDGQRIDRLTEATAAAARAAGIPEPDPNMVQCLARVLRQEMGPFPWHLLSPSGPGSAHATAPSASVRDQGPRVTPAVQDV